MLRWTILFIALVISGGGARAHLASDSYLRIELSEDGRIGGQWDIALRDLDVAVGLDVDQDGAITWGELRGKTREAEAYAFGRLILARGGMACRIFPAAMMVDYHAGIAYAVIPFGVECALGGPLTLDYHLLFDLDPTHRGLLTISDGGRIQSEVLTPEHAKLELDQRHSGSGEQLAQFVLLGFDHILLGYDHLLFIAVLLATAAMNRGRDASWKPTERLARVLTDTIKTLTAFTLAHATVLTPALIWPVNVPARLVEPAVAATIIVTGIDNFWRILPGIRWHVAFVFGLIHGLSFASTLGPMRLPPLSLGLALCGFNLGVEAGQIAIALLLVPIAFLIRHEFVYRTLVAPSVSIAAALLACAWFIDRVFALDLLSFQPTTLATISR